VTFMEHVIHNRPKMQIQPTNGEKDGPASLLLKISDLESETWVRTPGNGDRIQGLSRAALYRIVNDPTSGVASVSLRQPGTYRGTHLIGLNSLRAYIARQAIKQIASR
jgi:hypothetical protein